MRLAGIFIVGLAVGWASGPPASAGAASPLAVTTTTEPTMQTIGGQSRVEVELEVQAVRGGAGARVADIGATLRSHFDHPARVVYVYELVTDTGHTVMAPQHFPVRQLDQKGAEHHEVLSTPAGLADGYYQIRITAAGTDDHEGVASTAHAYFRVVSGDLIALEHDEFVAKSKANMGVSP